jgi:hypothetical protein
MAQYFCQTDNTAFYSELLVICQYFFAIPGQNANVERIFSMINSQWTKERNRLKLSTVKAILSVVYNCRHVSCKDFFEKVKGCNLPEGMVHCLGISRRAFFVLGGSFSTKIGRHGFG